MILIDVNLLICAYVPTVAQHEAAKDWLEQRPNDASRVGLPWPSLLAFMRIVTNPDIRAASFDKRGLDAGGGVAILA